MSELAATRTLPPPSMKDVIVSTFIFPPKSADDKKVFTFRKKSPATIYLFFVLTLRNSPSTDGEKIIKWSYRNWPYLISDREGSSAVLKVMSNPRSEEDRCIIINSKNGVLRLRF